MPNQIDYLTPKRRVILAWTLIALAILCQFSSLVSVAKIFVIFTAVAIHEMLVRRPTPAWVPRAGKIVSIVALAVILVLYFYHRLPREVVIYVALALLCVPFAVTQVVNDVKYVRHSATDAGDTAQQPEVEERA